MATVYDYFTKYGLGELKDMLEKETDAKEREAISLAIKLKESPLSKYPLNMLVKLYNEEVKDRKMSEEEFAELQVLILVKREEAVESIEPLDTEALKKLYEEYPVGSAERAIIRNALKRRLETRLGEAEKEAAISDIEYKITEAELKKTMVEYGSALKAYFDKMGVAWKQYAVLQEAPVFTSLWAQENDKVSASDEAEAFDRGIWNLEWGLPIENHRINYSPEKALVVLKKLKGMGAEPDEDWTEAVRRSNEIYERKLYKG